MTMKFEDQTISLIGDVTFSTVQSLFEQFEILMKKLDNEHYEMINVDFSNVDKIDTASLALCVEIKKKTNTVSFNVHYLNVPDEMLIIAQSVGIESLFKD